MTLAVFLSGPFGVAGDAVLGDIPNDWESLLQITSLIFLTIPNDYAAMRVMAYNTKGITASFPIAEREQIEARLRELKLPLRGGLSLYFQMLRDYDAHVRLVPHYHPSDGKLHFYPPEKSAYPQAAEAPPAAKITSAPPSKHVPLDDAPLAEKIAFAKTIAAEAALHDPKLPGNPGIRNPDKGKSLHLHH